MPAAVSGSRLFTPSHSWGRQAWACRARARRYRSRLRAVWWPILTMRSLPPLAADGDFPLPQVDVAVPRVAGIVAEAGQLGQPDAGGPEYRDDRGVAALGEGA